MSLVTRCPSCGTTFKVVRDQLRISDGWVRCGRCSNVFDATIDLQDQSEAPAAPPSDPIPPEDPAPPDGGDVDLKDEATQPAASDWTSIPEFYAEPQPEPEVRAEPEPEPGAEQIDSPATPVPPPLPAWPSVGVMADEPWPARPAPLSSTESVPLLAQESFTSSAEALDEFSAVVDQSANAQLQKALRRARIEAVRNARARRAEAGDARSRPMSAASNESAPIPLVSAASAEGPFTTSPADLRPPLPAFARPSFLSPIEHAARASAPGPLSDPVRRTKLKKRAIGVAIGLGALLLALQVLRHERDAIVARQPSWRPAMEALCKATGCELAALRRIGDITIDGAAFAREKTGDGYRLDFTLRNGVTIPLAMPAVELTLLDTQERAVVRRVLMPGDFGAPPVLAARAERNVSLPLVLSGSEAAALPPVAGYRVVAFYP